MEEIEEFEEMIETIYNKNFHMEGVLSTKSDEDEEAEIGIVIDAKDGIAKLEVAKSLQKDGLEFIGYTLFYDSSDKVDKEEVGENYITFSIDNGKAYYKIAISPFIKGKDETMLKIESISKKISELNNDETGELADKIKKEIDDLGYEKYKRIMRLIK